MSPWWLLAPVALIAWVVFIAWLGLGIARVEHERAAADRRLTKELQRHPIESGTTDQ